MGPQCSDSPSKAQKKWDKFCFLVLYTKVGGSTKKNDI